MICMLNPSSNCFNISMTISFNFKKFKYFFSLSSTCVHLQLAGSWLLFCLLVRVVLLCLMWRERDIAVITGVSLVDLKCNIVMVVVPCFREMNS